MYNVQDFKKAEREILASLDWKLQLVSLFDLLEYYVSQGLLFTNDEINGEEIQFQKTCSPSPHGNDQNTFHEQKFTSPFLNTNRQYLAEKNNSARLNSSASTGIQHYGHLANEKKVYEIIGLLEKDVAKLALLISKDLSFYEWDIKILVAAAIAFLRKINGITPIWYLFLFLFFHYLKES